MKKIVRIVLIVVGIFSVIFLLTNPTPNDFKSYLSATHGKNRVEASHYGRIHNYLLWSVYSMTEERFINTGYGDREKDEGYFVDGGTYRYYGFIKNFFVIHSNDANADETLDSVELKRVVMPAMDSVMYIPPPQ